MGIFDGCLLAADIDGTLIENGYINPINLEKIEFFTSEGGCFSLSTGRTMAAVSDAVSKIKNLSPSVVANGCMIYDFKNSDILYEKLIDNSDYHIIKKILDLNCKIGIEVHSRGTVFFLNHTRELDLHKEYEKFDTVSIDFDTVCKYPWNKALFSFDSNHSREKLYKLLENETYSCRFVDTSALIKGELQNYVEQIPSGVSKFSALKKLCDILNIKKGSLFAIGDYYNDLEMIKNADISAVPFTSPEDIKEHATYITRSCKDGAVADFIDFLTNKYTL